MYRREAAAAEEKKAHGILLGHNGDILKRQPLLLFIFFSLFDL